MSEILIHTNFYLAGILSYTFFLFSAVFIHLIVFLCRYLHFKTNRGDSNANLPFLPLNLDFFSIKCYNLTTRKKFFKKRVKDNIKFML